MERFSEADLKSLIYQNSDGRKELCLSGRHLIQVPDAVMGLKEVEVLDLSNNELTQLPDQLKNLNQLAALLLSDNKLTELPEDIGQLKNLTTLDVSYNKLQTVPGTIANLKQLTTLNLGFNELKMLPREICHLKMLVTLDIKSNPIQSIPSEITNLKHLSTLLMADNMLKELPNFICHLRRLSKLDVSCNGLTQLPKSFSSLNQLHALNLSINRLEELPETIFQLKRLTALDVSWNHLKNIPNKIENLNQLTSLHLNGNRLFELPEAICKLESLRTLDVSLNHLVSLPTSLKCQTKLNTLLLNSNRLYQIPVAVFQLDALSTLDVGCNKLQRIPDRISHLTELTTLRLSSNELMELPESVFQLKRLTTLNASDNCLTRISEGIVNLDQLHTINLERNLLQELPSGIFRLKMLTALMLSSNQLEKIQDNIANLDQLTILDLSNNRLEELPQAVFQLKMLTTLLLSSNKLKILQEDIANLDQLVTLELSDNSLEDLPETICKLNRLITLNLTDNQLKTLPLGLVSLSNLKFLEVNRNPLQSPPAKVCEHGLPAILTYLQEIRKGKAFHQKVVLLGSSGAGKTSLANTLAKNKPSCVDEKDRTIVLDRISWEIESQEKLMDVSVIDFGGDDIYKIVHHLFLDENSLVLLVVNLVRYSDETYMRDMGSWINVLKTRVPKARVILVGTHLDCLESEEEICSKVETVKAHFSRHFNEGSSLKSEDFVTVSSKDFQGMKELRIRILNVVAKNGKAIPSDWLEIYNGLQSSEITEGQSFLTFDVVKQLVESRGKRFWGIFRRLFESTDERTKSVLSFFHDVGLLLWYRHSEELTKFVFHRAEFLTEVMKVVFSAKLAEGSLACEGSIRHFFTTDSFEEAKQNLLKRGIFSRTLLKALWKRQQIEEEVFDAMVDLFIHLDLCYPINNEEHEGGLRFPWFLPEDVPDVPCVHKFLHEVPCLGCHRLSLKYVYPAMCPTPLYHNFAVRLHRHILDLKSRYDWKDGMYAHVKESRVLVHRSSRATESIVKVSVEGSDLLELWSLLLACHEELTTLMQQWPGLRWECWIVCPCCTRMNITEPGSFPQSNLKETKYPKGRVTCNRHDEKVPVCLVYPLRQGNYDTII